MTDKIAAILNALDEDRTQALERLFSFLKIKSISTDPAFKADCRAAAEWSAATLNDIGFDASIRDTTGHPMVVGHYRSKAPGNVPHVLFYGHYDVQPPDPLGAKSSDGFGPIGPQISRGLDYHDLELTTRLNGEVVQNERTSRMIFSIAEIVAFITRYVTLEPGDIIFTGTPGTTATINPGDEVEVEIEGCGVLRNPVVGDKFA